MTQILSLGAINKYNGEYVYPKIANKKDKYICPECNKDLILCQGEIRVHHFRHKVDSVNPCYKYNNPTELQIHKDAQLLIKHLLERKITISLVRNCCCCEINEQYEIPEMSETSVIELEYRFEYNGLKIADVEYIDDGKLLCIFEIYNTHKTCNENRPEPWFEINAETLINLVNNNTATFLQIPCIRCEKCENCTEMEKTKIELYNEKIKQNKIEKDRQEKEKKEYLIHLQEEKIRETIKQEEEKIRKKNEEKRAQYCNCLINKLNICICKNPKYELCKLNNELYCVICSNWKCRCK